MAEQQPTQKQISRRYDGTANYPTHVHYFRRLRLWFFAGVAIASSIGALAYSLWGRTTVFSPGPISQNHSRFVNDCRVCHFDIDRGSTKLGRLLSFTSASPGPGPAHGPANAPMAGMDRACLQCHGTAALHLPQAASVRVRTISDELTIVHAAGCAECHREHVGLQRMALPTQQSCIACHGNAEALRTARTILPLVAHDHLAASGENRDLGDGVVRFLTPHLPVDQIPTFTGYAEGHPGFSWETPGARDPASLKFNHQRHLSGIPSNNNRSLTCTDCHQAGADGAFMQPIKYERHCSRCHTLLFQPSLPKLLIPHGDPVKVRYFLASREILFGLAVRDQYKDEHKDKGEIDPGELKKRVDDEMRRLDARVSLNGKTPGASPTSPQADLFALEKRVFFEGDPPGGKTDLIGRRSVRQFLTACWKCHNVTEGDVNHAPKVEMPNMAQRWIQHGPFTHRAHEHMECISCHGAALQSQETSDILLPAQKLCAECHRPPVLSTENLHDMASGRHDAHSPLEQRTHGGIQWDCTSCHKFHASPDVFTILKTLPAAANLRADPPP